MHLLAWHARLVTLLAAKLEVFYFSVWLGVLGRVYLRHFPTLQVFWPLDDSWFKGSVMSYNSSSHRYHV